MNRFLTTLVLSVGLASGGLAAGDRLEAVRDLLYMQSAASITASMVARQDAYADLRRASPRLAEDALDRYRANWLYVLRYIAPLRLVVDRNLSVFTVDELLFNIRYSNLMETPPQQLPWNRMRTSSYDQLPRPILEVILRKQMEQYDHLLQGREWLDISMEEWSKLPGPVRKTATFHMVWQWAGRRDPGNYGMTQPEAARTLISIGLVESLFDLDKTSNRNQKTGNEDRGYFQISDMVRSELARVPEFSCYRTQDYYHPWVSVQAASYHFFVRLMERAEGDALRAIGWYNTGPAGDRRLAQGYRLAVADRYLDTFVSRDQYSPTRYLMLQHAEPAYFSDVRSDRLFEFAATHWVAAVN